MVSLGNDSVRPTIWGLDPVRLHDRFWASRGVHVLRPGQDVEVAQKAELFMLAEPDALAIFRLRPLLATMSWVDPALTYVRLSGSRHRQYRETAMCDGGNRFTNFVRDYGGPRSRQARFAFTRDLGLAELWHDAPDARQGWRTIRRELGRARREAVSVTGMLYDTWSDEELAQFVVDLIQIWKRPDATIPGLSQVSPRIWAGEGTPIDSSVLCLGPAWIGAGRAIPEGATVIGPAALWDNPEARPTVDGLRWTEIEPTEPLSRQPERSRPYRQRGKRLFDIIFSLAAMLLTLPFYPFIMLAIWLEDGRPFFFAHKRETIGGREFPCLKFRSMRRDAEAVKAKLKNLNRADGPQFHLVDDPRLTHIGRILRKYNIDELPQFINVLLGHMSVVGPRPSPYKENQFCPAWREARLSVRPGITGLWQIRRTRRPGADFQEWIKYDLEYVQKWGWGMELSIILRTIWMLLGR